VRERRETSKVRLLRLISAITGCLITVATLVAFAMNDRLVAHLPTSWWFIVLAALLVLGALMYAQRWLRKRGM